MTIQTPHQILFQESLKLNLPQPVFEQLILHYSHLNRKYHNLDHLVSVLHEASFAEPYLTKFEFDSLRLALWFHDIIQQGPLKSFLSDEELSSAWMVKSCTGRFHANIVSQASNLIDLTGRHVATNGILSNVEGIMICCDLSILGQSPDLYRQYASQIRDEYSYLTNHVYVPGRLKVLRSLLLKAQNDYLFPHPRWSALYTEPSIRNINNEIDALAKIKDY